MIRWHHYTVRCSIKTPLSFCFLDDQKSHVVSSLFIMFSVSPMTERELFGLPVASVHGLSPRHAQSWGCLSEPEGAPQLWCDGLYKTFWSQVTKDSCSHSKCGHNQLAQLSWSWGTWCGRQGDVAEPLRQEMGTVETHMGKTQPQGPLGTTNNFKRVVATIQLCDEYTNNWLTHLNDDY